MFMLDLTSGVPIYEQLKNKTLELIHAGVLKQDMQMPSVRSLAKELGINPNTIQKAYQDMEREGIIYSAVGKGSFVADGAGIENKAVQSAKDKFKKAAHEAKLYRISLQEAQKILQEIYEEEIDV